MKKQYTQPELYIENVVVENGIAVSPAWGGYGAAGMSGNEEDGYVDGYGDF